MRTALGTAQGTRSIGGVPLDTLAAAVGTPAFVYDAGTVTARYRELSAALAGVPHRIHYACKANGTLGLLTHLRGLGARIDVVSGGELFRAQRAGFAPEDIIFGGVGKSRVELQEAIEARVHLVSVESEAELALINELAGASGAVVRVGVRVNPEVAVESVHDYIKTGQKGDKFGVPWDEAERVARLAATLPHLRLVAVGIHIGSQLTDLGALAEGIRRLEALVARLREEGITSLEHVDVGGGLFVPYNDEAPADLAAYAAIVGPAGRRLGLEVIVEPGRFLVAESGVLVTRVLYRKRSGGRELLVTDAGMTDLLRPSHYDAYHRILAVHPTPHQATFDVVGPICESGDFLALARTMEAVQAGELLVVCTAGAYGACMSSNYNSRPRACEVLVQDGQWAVITERESYAAMVQRESPIPQWRSLS
jgi:diaminopimelate decarboxylase